VLNVLPPEGATTTTTSSTTTTAPADPAATTTSTEPTTTTTVPEGTTSREEDVPDKQVVLPELDRDGNVMRRYVLGPAELTGKVVRTARAQAPQGFTGDWSVTADFTGAGSRQFDELAQRNFQRQVAIVLDGVVKSAPTINAQQFNGTAEITGQFSEREAKDLALVLRFGALPVQLEPQEVRTISATLGRDSLNAGVAAGVGGLLLVLTYIVFYYRALGLVVVLGLMVWGALQWSVISFLGETYGLALSLAGAVGIIVSVGVTVDSYIVYFERLKDEIRSGKTIRSSVDRGFNAAFRTIRTADISSLIGSVLLYWLTVGPVRGFAFFLGLSTVLDLVVAYFFTRPLVGIFARNRVFTEAKWLGIARGLNAPAAASASPGGGGA
jgi:preprotein translocase subunit SecD